MLDADVGPLRGWRILQLRGEEWEKGWGDDWIRPD